LRRRACLGRFAVFAERRMVGRETFFEELNDQGFSGRGPAYVLVAGVASIPACSAVFPAVGMPQWSLRLGIVCLLRGLFPSRGLSLAWPSTLPRLAIQATPPSRAPAGGPARHRSAQRPASWFRRALAARVSSAGFPFILPPRGGRKKWRNRIAGLARSKISKRR